MQMGYVRFLDHLSYHITSYHMRRPFLMYLGPSSCSSLYVIQAPIAGPEDQLRETEVVQWPQSLIFIGGFL